MEEVQSGVRSWHGHARIVCAGLAIVSACAWQAPAAASPINLVQNGSFEDSTATYNYNGTQIGTEVSNSNLANWQVTGCTTYCGFQFLGNSNLGSSGIYDQEDGHQSTFYSTPGASPDGGNVFISDATHETQVLNQAIAGLRVGDIYTVSFYQASMQQTGFSGAYTANWGVGLGSFAQPNGLPSATMYNPSQGSTGWVKQSLSFVANATNETLFFLAMASNGANPPFLLLDGVTLTDDAVAVPEPGTIGMAAVGLIGLTLIRRRRRA